MAKTQRRRKKHRGTQAGTVKQFSRGPSRTDARGSTRGSAQQRRQDRLSRPPSWRSAFNRAALAASVFLAVLVLLLKQDIGPAVGLAAFMFVLYIPMGYFMDSFIFRMRQRRKQQRESSE